MTPDTEKLVLEALDHLLAQTPAKRNTDLRVEIIKRIDNMRASQDMAEETRRFSHTGQATASKVNAAPPPAPTVESVYPKQTPLEAAHDWLAAWGHEDCQLKPALAALIESREREAVEAALTDLRDKWCHAEDPPNRRTSCGCDCPRCDIEAEIARLEKGAAGKKPTEVSSPPVAAPTKGASQ